MRDATPLEAPIRYGKDAEVAPTKASVGELVERALDGLGRHPVLAIRGAAAIRELATRAVGTT